MNLGTPELLVILVIVLILFGGNKIPSLMRGLGEGIRNFKEGMRDNPNPQRPSNENPPPPASEKK
jgi:sec-independent protein translocase protein TatA